MPDIAIIGLGSLGVALGRSIKASLPSARVAGFDPSKAASKRASEAGAVDEAGSNMAQAVAGAQLIVLATPLAAAQDVLRILGQFAPADTVVTDTCSLKTPVLRWANEFLPSSVHFVGGHPLFKQLAADEVSLQGVDYCIIPGLTASSEAIDAVIGLANASGARPFFIDAAEHDSFVIATEHLPRLAAGAAVDAASTAVVWRDVRRFQSAGFASAVDEADLDLNELAIAFEHAPESLIAWTDRLTSALASLRSAMESNGDAAQAAEFLEELAETRRGRLSPTSLDTGPALERQSFSSLLLGDWFANRTRLGQR